MKLISLTIENFKGIQRFDHRFDGRNATIYGANGTGKTTVQDAILWLLFGRDSQERCDFSIKPLDRNGNVTQHGIEVAVAATIEQSEKTVTLRKVYREKWTKQRGSADAVFTGHESLCYVDDVPVSARSYADTIGGMIDEKIFRAITNVRWFAGLKWQERREMLFRMGGDVPTEELFDDELAPLRAALQGRTVDDLRKILQASMRGHNKDLSDLPIRIDEAQRILDQSVDDGEDVDASIASLRERLQAMDIPSRADELAVERAGVTVKIGQLDADNRIHRQNQLARAAEDKNSRRHVLKLEIDGINQQILSARQTINYYAEEAQTAEQKAAALRDEWTAIDREEWGGDKNCPTCGRPLPKAQVEEAMDRWESQQASRLSQIVERGKSAMLKKEEAQRKSDEANAKIPALQERAKALEDQLAALEREPAFVPDDMPGYAERLRGLQDQQRALDLKIAEAQKHADPTAQTIRADAHARLSALQVKREARRRNAETKARIEELRRRHKEVAAAYERCACLLQLCEAYTRRHMALTEARINGLFALVKWKLYEDQVNGGIADTCIPTVDGVPYGDLNNAARINAGIDIINTLSRFYGVTAPIFIDNAESVTHLLPMSAQVIRLVVSEHDPVLRVA